MKPYVVNGLQIQDVTGVNGAMQPTAYKQVIFYVDQNGPFRIMFAEKNYTPENVLSAINAQVDKLKAIDAALSGSE